MISDPETGSTDPWLEEATNVISKVSVQAQPRVLIELNRIARQPDVSFESVADLVVKDVGLCAKLLNDKIEKKSDTYTPFSQSKDTLVRICGVLGFGPQVLPELEQDLLAALEGDKYTSQLPRLGEVKGKVKKSVQPLMDTDEH